MRRPPFDPFTLSRTSLGAPSQPLLDVMGTLTGRGIAPGMVSEYLRLWLQSLSQATGGVSGDRWDDVSPKGVGPEHAAWAANLESLTRELASGDWEQTAELIKRIHAAREAGSTARVPSTPNAPTVPSRANATLKNGDSDPEVTSAYDRARRHLLEHEEEERRRAWLTDRILDQLRSPNLTVAPSSNPLQTELRLSCPVHGRAAGRFRISNPTERDFEFDLRASRVQGAPPEWAERLPIQFEPRSGVLRGGEEGVIKVNIDSAGCPLLPGAVLELVIDVFGSGHLVHKVWVSIELTKDV